MSPEIAVTLKGTDWMLSARRSAVTTMARERGGLVGGGIRRPGRGRGQRRRHAMRQPRWQAQHLEMFHISLLPHDLWWP